MILDGKRLLTYNLVDNEEKLIIDNLEVSKTSIINICYNGILTALSIDQKLYITEKAHTNIHQHTTCITSVALNQRKVAFGDITGKIMITDSSLK